MDEVRNPFTPGAGSQPPELAGREKILEDASIVQSARKADILTFRSMQMSQNINGLDIMMLLDRLDYLSLSVQSKCEEIAAILSEKLKN